MFVLQFAQEGHWTVSSVGGHLHLRRILSVVSTWQKALPFAFTRMEAPTQTELPQKHSAIQVLGCMDCQSLSLVMDSSSEKAVCSVTRWTIYWAKGSRKVMEYQGSWASDRPIELNSAFLETETEVHTRNCLSSRGTCILPIRLKAWNKWMEANPCLRWQVNSPCPPCPPGASVQQI